MPGFRRTLLHTIVFPEDGDDWLVFNFGTYIPPYTALHYITLHPAIRGASDCLFSYLCLKFRNTFPTFYICGSVHRNSRLRKSNKMQQYADVYLLLNYSTCFGRPSRPLSGVHKNVVTASGTDHTIWEASFFRHDNVVTFEEVCSPNGIICTRG